MAAFHVLPISAALASPAMLTRLSISGNIYTELNMWRGVWRKEDKMLPRAYEGECL